MSSTRQQSLWCVTCQKETKRYSASGKCFSCTARARIMAMPAERRSALARDRALAIPTDVRSARARDRSMKRSPGQRKADSSKAGLASIAKHGGSPLTRLTTEQRRANRARQIAESTPEQLSEIARKARANELARDPQGFYLHIARWHYAQGRGKTRAAITYKRAKIAALEAELAELTG